LEVNKLKTYLVTGGAGFIGTNYIQYMFDKYKEGIRIINVDSLTYAGNLENLVSVKDYENYVFIKEDICNKEAMHQIFREYNIDRVVHFAAESHVDRSIRDPQTFVNTNVLGTLNLLDAAKCAKSISRFPPMKFTDLWKKNPVIFMKQPPLTLTVLIRRVKHLPICWLKRT